MRVKCPPCRVCHQSSVLDGVDAPGFIEWSEMGKLIQEALPQLDADQRELLMTGTHAHCWEKIMGGSDDD